MSDHSAIQSAAADRAILERLDARRTRRADGPEMADLRTALFEAQPMLAGREFVDVRELLERAHQDISSVLAGASAPPIPEPFMELLRTARLCCRLSHIPRLERAVAAAEADLPHAEPVPMVDA